MKIVVVASHSAGHILPAIAFCQGLQERDVHVKIDFISTDGQIEKRLLKDKFSSVLFFKREKMTILAVCRLIVLFFRANSLINRLRPELVVGFGGYLSVPFVICAYLKKIPNFIHEQNFNMGFANRILSQVANQLIFSFPNFQISDRLKEKTLFLGFPLRKEIRRFDRKEASEYFGLDSDKFTMLVMGGSQGAMSLNSKLINILKKKAYKDMQVIHITGFFDYNRVEREYKDIEVKSKILPFVDQMGCAFSACDFVICRAGAGTIAEIVALRIPSVLIPYPYAKLHQLNNARFLSERNAAIVIEDKDSCEAILGEKIVKLKNNSVRLKQMSQALSKINMPDAREKMAELALNFAS